MALALYRRYRPDTFEGVIGQDQVTVPLMRALDEKKLTHAYLFSGPRGCGKTSSARILARCVNCAKGPTSHPCGECESCRDLATGGPGSIDVVEIDAASHNGVDDARELRDRVAAMPARDRYKIFILDEAHMVTPQGFNALLKTVEEPPDHVMFIFATTEPDKVIGTIRSRTHHYPFRLVPPEVMGPYLESICAKEGIKPEPGVLRLTMRAGGGSVRDTLSVLDQLMVGSVDGVISQDSAVALLGFTPGALIGEAIDAVTDHDGEALYGVVQKVVVGGFDPRRFVEDLLSRVRDLLVLTLGGAKAESVLSDDAAAEDMGELKRQSQALGLQRLTAMAETINTALGSMSGATSPRMRLELLAARLLAGPVTAAAVAGASAEAGAGDSVAGHEAAPAARGGFAGAARNQQHTGFAGVLRRQEGHDSLGPAERHEQAGVGNAGTGFAPVATAQTPAGAGTGWGQTPAMPASDAPEAQRGQAPGVSAPAPQVSGQSAASPDVSAGVSAGEGKGTPDERWDALVAGLPADVAAYVSREKVPRIKLVQDARTGAGRLWIKFDTPLSKYAFAIAMADEDVDGSRKVVDILRAATRRTFGERVLLAPAEKMADGQMAPPLSQLTPAEQSSIKSRIAMAKAGIAAAGLASAIAGPVAAKEPKTDSAAGDAAAADADDVHRGGRAERSDQSARSGQVEQSGVAGWAGHMDTGRTGQTNGGPDDGDDPWAASTGTAAAFGTPAMSGVRPQHGNPSASDLPDDDPWVTPAGQADAGASVTEPPRTQEHEEHHTKHVAVPDLSDDTDPWATPPSSAGESSAAGKPNESGVPDTDSRPQTGAIGAQAVRTGNQAQQVPVNGPFPANGPVPPLPYEPEPDDRPMPAYDDREAAGAYGNEPYGGEPYGSDARQQDDPWTRPTAGQPGGMRTGVQLGVPVAGRFHAAQTGPQSEVPLPNAGVGPDDDEYSMNDEVLGQGTAMAMDDLKKLFEVKKVEEFAADDPRNPGNMQKAKAHDDE